MLPMNINKEYIDNLLSYGERISLECKKAEKDIPKSFWETYSSFANTIGGDIILGVYEDQSTEDNSQRFIVTGVTNVAKMKKTIFDTLNSNKVNKNIICDDDVHDIQYDEKHVLLVHVPQADYKQRPIFINGNVINGSFKRNFEGDYHCTEEEVKAMLRDSNDSGNDGIMIDNYNIDDIDAETLAAYRTRFRQNNPDHILNEKDDKEFLLNLVGYKRNRNTNRESLTLAGLLMFGKGLSIRERFDNIRLDYIDKTNIEGDSRWSDRLTYDGRWENNLYNFFTRIQSKLTTDIKRPFVLNGTTRVDDTPVHKAIREALTNMIIHADYLVTGVLKVEKLPDGFRFVNPGSLKLPLEEIYKGGTSRARNPKMQDMMRMIGFGDNIGSGIPTILSAWEKENWRKPELYANVNANQVELNLSMVSFIPKDCSDFLNNLFRNKYTQLNNESQIILATACLEGEITNSRTQRLLGINPIEAGKTLYRLTEIQMLVAEKTGRWTKYHVNTDYKEFCQVQNRQGQKSSRPNRQGQKEILINKIIKYCKVAKSLKEIALHVGYKDRFNLKRKYLNTLINEKKLGLTIPEKVDAKGQKYITLKEKSDNN